ncbi:hypothetical protein EPUS_02561 [Endocarpon pusillum Z07020]|uniref:CHRD domain-containing protein n=1 Tax=Endocarpon pusillum (strain Z07020 / HMAS-L-300199) TaxID=1263415 RepID=U1HKE5_ENDPU|nr:uncharacterized protein EPUS_02561 [Endocarpon pusillum Z07020]ERF70695.1 hypothetical protein EPUS_02561 [Endocarpon pusillum Z07020]
MKTTGILSGVFALLVASAVAVPTDYYPPSGNGNNNGRGHGKGGNDRDCQNGPFKFTSTYNVVATPDQVVNGTTPTGGLPGCTGFFDYGINSDLNLICWNIKLVDFRGEYQSPARTATHIHQGARGASGPFTTGILANGTDTGTGFTVKQIEDNPSGFFTDVHSSLAPPGAVRGQLA